MVTTHIKYFFIFLGCAYTSYSLMNIKLYNKKILYTLFLACYFLFFFIMIFTKYNISDLFLIILNWIFSSLFSYKPKIAFISTLLSYGITYGFFLCSSSIIIFLFLPFQYPNTFEPETVFITTTGLTTIIFIFTISKIKRFRHGMPFLYSKNFVNIGTILSIFFFGLLTYIQTTDNTQLIFYVCTSVLLAISLAALIFWWQAQLTKSYLHKLQLLELESLRKELEETTKEMEHLKKQNEELGRLIHKDNKLIPALEAAVIDFLSADGVEKNKALGASLIRQLKELSGSRREILDEVSAARSRHFATGIPALDTLLDYFDRRAEARKMEFTVNIAPNLAAYVPSKISSEDITHLLADLLENAIIAVAPCASRKIRLQIYPYRKWFVIELSDTGIPFQEKSLLQFGIQQLTTHESSGGSGIGLMDIWKLKEKYHASIHITEYRDTAPFSKRITFLLDHRSQYLIRTWRFEELRAKSRRADLCILPPGDEVSSSEKKEGRHTE